MTISCKFRLTAYIICLGIALDNGINTFYYLNLENWSTTSTLLISISSLLLNGLLYHHGAQQALKETWTDAQKLIKRPNLKTFTPYVISIVSAYVMATFTMHNYIEGKIHIPMIITYLFTVCYFIGTHTLIIQATKINLGKQVMMLKVNSRILFFIWFAIFMFATASAIPQWTTGIQWITNDSTSTNIASFITYIGEAFFVGQLSIWLSKIKLNKVIKPLFPIIAIFATLNAIGFACMTEYDSWLTSAISSQATFTLGFILSFFMMLKSLTELKK